MLEDLGRVTPVLGLTEGTKLRQTDPVTPSTALKFPLLVSGEDRRGQAQRRTGTRQRPEIVLLSLTPRRIGRFPATL